MSIPGSFKILLWGCNHYVHGVTYIITAANNWRAESQSGLTHEKFIPTYQFENTLVCVTLDGIYNFPSSICGLVHSGSRPFNYGTKFTACFLFIHFRRRSSTVILRLVLSTHSYQYICAINSCHNNYILVLWLLSCPRNNFTMSRSWSKNLVLYISAESR